MPSLRVMRKRAVRPFRRFREAVRHRWHRVKEAVRHATDGSRYHYLGPELALTRLRHGYFLYVDPLDETVSHNLIGHGHWEEPVHRVVRGLIRPGDITVEVGANLGYYTIQMARSVGPEGRVVSFEANPRMASYLKRSVIFNGVSDRIDVIEKAASDTTGRLSFMLSRRFSGSGHLLVTESGIAEDQSIIEVDAIRVDDLGLDRIDFLRMDAEGSEPLILKGAEKALSNPEITICMEWSPIQIRSRASVPELVDWLAAQGFKFWRIEPDSSLMPLAVAQLPSLDHCDIILSRQTPRPNNRRVRVQEAESSAPR